MTVFTDYEQKQIDELHKELTGAKAIAIPDLCTLWNIVRPYWSIVIGAAAKIPVVGWIIAALLGALGKALEACCPQPAPKDAKPDADHHEIEEAFAAVIGGGPAAKGDRPCCNIWKKLQKYWPKIVAVVRKVSPKLADILQKIGDALDKFCG